MVFDKIENCCNFAIAALDGVYGWLSEAIAILIFVFICNFLVKWILKKLHIRFEKQKSFWKDSFVQALYTPLSYYVWFFALVHAYDIISIRTQDEISLPRMHTILSVGCVLAIAWFFMRWKKNVVNFTITRSKNREIAIDPGKIDAIDKIATASIAFFTLLVILEITNSNMNTLIAFGGVGGLALAFASQEIIANFFGGFMIYLTQPFAVGDWINIPERNIEGHVEEIGWYTTFIRTLEKRPVYVPNSIFSKLILMNPSRMSHRQIKECLGIRYEDMPKMKEILQAIHTMLNQHPDIDHSQPIIVRFTSFGQYSLDFLVQAYTRTTDTNGFSKVKEDVLFKIADLVKEHGVDFAYPTHNVVVVQEAKTTL